MPAPDTSPFARALARVLPDGHLVVWDGSPLYVPCGDVEAASAVRLLAVEPGTRPDLPWELEVRVPAGTPVVVGTLTPSAPPATVAVPVRAAFVAEAPELTVARVVKRP